MWSRETLIPGLYSTEWYNGKKIQEGWLANNEDYLVGVPRLRLLRVKEGRLFHSIDLANVTTDCQFFSRCSFRFQLVVTLAYTNIKTQVFKFYLKRQWRMMFLT